LTHEIAERTRAEKRWRSVFDNSAIGITTVDTSLRITAANRALQTLGGHSENELTAHTVLDFIYPDDRQVVADANHALFAKRTLEFQLEVRYLKNSGEVIWVRATASLIHETNEAPQILALIEDISARKIAESRLRESIDHLRTLTGRLMRAQDDERRRIAQMLHETTAQELAALKMHLARLARTAVPLPAADRAALTQGIELAEQSMTGIRTLSYLLHPPFLDEAGLLSALRWYVEGFAERSGITVDLDLPSTFERLPQDVETTLFRVVQEALINIHHHAESQTASIHLRLDGQRLTLEIEDRGRGMPSELVAQLATGGSAMGVGVAGMHERLQQLGGTLDIESTDRGTTVRARIPLPPNAP
jgi:PAS domain S-box-containing protein